MDLFDLRTWVSFTLKTGDEISRNISEEIKRTSYAFIVQLQTCSPKWLFKNASWVRKEWLFKKWAGLNIKKCIKMFGVMFEIRIETFWFYRNDRGRYKPHEQDDKIICLAIMREWLTFKENYEKALFHFTWKN